MLDPSQFIQLSEGKILLEEAVNEMKTSLNQQEISVKKSNTFGVGFMSLITAQSQELTFFEIEWNQYFQNVSNFHPESPLKFWKNCNLCSMFTLVAKKVLAIPASSAYVERLFSYAGLNKGKLRTSMVADIVEACILVYKHHTNRMCHI